MTPFLTGRFYAHRNMKDVCFRVEACHFRAGEWACRLRVSWWHRKGYPLGVTEDIVVRDPENYRMVKPVDCTVKEVDCTQEENSYV